MVDPKDTEKAPRDRDEVEPEGPPEIIDAARQELETPADESNEG
jgi:hypothetical protein